MIVGGGVAGTTAAETIRQNDPQGTITILSDEPYRFYSRIMLSKPNFFLEKIPFEQVWLKSESWYAENKIALLAGKNLTQLDPKGKVATLGDGTQLHYQKLLLAIGACARKWGVPGADKKGVLSLRRLDDAKEIISRVKTAKQAILIGSGFVSFEMAEMLRMAGVEVTLVILESYYWEPLLDEASGRMIEKVLEGNGVKILHKSEVAEVVGGEEVEGVVLKDGTRLPCQLIIAGIGTFCPHDLAKAAGVEVNRGILANEFLETNVPDVWTAGDSAEFNDLVLGERIQLGNWVNAQIQGKVAGANMLGRKQPFKMVSFYTAQGFGIAIAFVGDVRMAPDREVVLRGSPQAGSYGRLILRNGKLIGATLLSLTRELGLLSKLIEKGVNLSPQKQNLSDLSFDLAKLIS